MVKRKYVMSKVAPGDYLLPGNDARTLWRIARYTDGPSSGLEIPRDREFWGVYRWTGDGPYVDVSWEMWEMVAGGFLTRSEAVDAAMGASA